MLQNNKSNPFTSNKHNNIVNPPPSANNIFNAFTQKNQPNSISGNIHPVSGFVILAPNNMSNSKDNINNSNQHMTDEKSNIKGNLFAQL